MWRWLSPLLENGCTHQLLLASNLLMGTVLWSQSLLLSMDHAVVASFWAALGMMDYLGLLRLGMAGMNCQLSLSPFGLLHGTRLSTALFCVNGSRSFFDPITFTAASVCSTSLAWVSLSSRALPWLSRLTRLRSSRRAFLRREFEEEQLRIICYLISLSVSGNAQYFDSCLIVWKLSSVSPSFCLASLKL